MQNGTKMAVHEFACVQVTSVYQKKQYQKSIKNNSSIPDAGYIRGLALHSSVTTMNIGAGIADHKRA